MILTYKYRLKDRSARRALARCAYGVNQVWNYCCAQQLDTQDRYRAGAPKRKWATHFDLSKLCRGVGKELGIHQQTVDCVCRQFADSRDKNRRPPQFRASFGSKRSLGWVPFSRQTRQVSFNSVIYLGKRFRWFGNKRRPLPDTAKGGAFVEDALGRWWVCFFVEVERTVANDNASAVGIDLGLKTLATLSDGHKVEAPRHYRSLEGKLAVARRSRNKRRVRAIHAKITNARRDFLHKLTTNLAARYALIAVGNVNSKRLAKTRMAKSVFDASWATLRRLLKYKSAGYIEVDENFTTQTCSGCGSIAGPKGHAGLNKRQWDCDGCGASHDRDVNSAINILRLGRSVAPPVEGSREIAA